MTLEKAIESYKFGFDVIGDGDSRIAMYGTGCNHCGEYFISKEMDVYCEKCVKKWKEKLNKEGVNYYKST